MGPTAPEPAVHIDAGNDAWLCFTLQRGAEDEATVREPWRAFTTHIAERLAAWVGDEHDASALAAVLIDTLASHPGIGIGVTWDGGIAVTYADYRGAERRLARAIAQGAARPQWR